MNDSAAPKEKDFQTLFIEASTKRTIVATFGEEENKKTIEITKWGFSKQCELSPALTRITLFFIKELPALTNAQEGENKIDLNDLILRVLSMSVLFEKCGPDMMTIARGSVRENFPNVDAAHKWVDSLDAHEMIELLLLIAVQNTIKEASKKKYADLAKNLSLQSQ